MLCQRCQFIVEQRYLQSKYANQLTAVHPVASLMALLMNRKTHFIQNPYKQKETKITKTNCNKTYSKALHFTAEKYWLIICLGVCLRPGVPKLFSP